MSKRGRGELHRIMDSETHERLSYEAALAALGKNQKQSGERSIQERATQPETSLAKSVVAKLLLVTVGLIVLLALLSSFGKLHG